MTVPNFDEVKHPLGEADFSGVSQGATFTADGDLFQLVSEIPGMLHLEVTDQFSRVAELIRTEPDKAISAINDMIRMMMTPASAELLITRMRSNDKPIGLSRAVKIIQWSIEQVTGRPTQPDEPSPNG